MTCRNIAEKLVESARREIDPGKVLHAHVRTCAACRERFEAELNLAVHLRTLRSAAWDRRSSAESREMLMAQFAARNRVRVMPRWYWALGAAAALLISICAAPEIGRRLSTKTETAQAVVADSSEGSGLQSGVQSGLQSDVPADPEAEGFIAVPYVPPLATGEMLRVVHTELNPAALASLGVNVDPALTAQLPADLLLGEDGMPRAVRVSDTTSGDGGF
jgi:hypothetical protein